MAGPVFAAGLLRPGYAAAPAAPGLALLALFTSVTMVSGCTALRGEAAAGGGMVAGAPLSTAAATAPAPQLSPAEVAALRGRIREHAKAHCGTCHQSTRPSHKAAAIAVYDLDRDDWHTMLTVPRLQRGFPRRLNRQLDEAGRRDLQAFIAHEVALRQR